MSIKPISVIVLTQSNPVTFFKVKPTMYFFIVKKEPMIEYRN